MYLSLLLTLVGCDGDSKESSTTLDSATDSATDTDSGTTDSGTTDSGTNTDADGDGVLAATDCDDADPLLWSGAPGLCDVVYEDVDTWRMEDGTETQVPKDSYSSFPTMEIQDGSGVSHSGSLVSEGRVEFTGVPTGTFDFLRQSQADPLLPASEPAHQLWTHLSQRHIDDNVIFAGRPDVAIASQSLPITLNATGLSPLNLLQYDEATGELISENDSLQFSSYNADALLDLTLDPADEGLGLLLSAGDTSFNGLATDWTKAYSYSFSGSPLPDSSRGDRLILNHLAASVETPAGQTDAWSQFILYQAVDSAVLNETLVDGSPITLNAAFTPLSKMSYNLDYRGDAFSAELDKHGTAYGYGYTSLFMTRDPGSPTPIVGVGPTLVSLETFTTEDESGILQPGDLQIPLSYGDPYTNGTELWTVNAYRVYASSDPHSGGTDSIVSSLSQSVPASEYDGVPMDPLVGLVSNLTVGGKSAPADSLTENVGLTPIVKFDPPEFGVPAYYSVALTDLEDVVGTTGSVVYKRRKIATFKTTETEVSLPAGLLETGSHYKVEVTAVVGLNIDDSAYSLVTAYSVNSTGRFTP